MPEFILSTRGDLPNYYVSFRNPLTGTYSTKRSTGTADRKKAEKIAYRFLVSGEFENGDNCSAKSLIEAIKLVELTLEDAAQIIEVLKQKEFVISAVLRNDRAAIPFTTFLETFWNYENSPYIREKLRKKHSIHKRYVARQSGAIKNYWKPFFKDLPLGSVTREQLNEFIDWIGKQPKPESAKGKNNIIKAGTLPLKWALLNDYLEKDLTGGILLFSGEDKKREILTPELASSLFQRKWNNQSSKLANLLAMCTGLRAGEIQGLRKQDLGKSCLYIRHSWNPADGLKTTKNNEQRTAEIVFPELMSALIEQANANPYNEGLDGYIFWATIPLKPMESRQWLEDLREVCKEVGIKDTAWVTFHAWRHFFATYMHGKVTDKVLQLATGHKTHSMLEHYANHTRLEDINDLIIAQKSVFQPILAQVVDW